MDQKNEELEKRLLSEIMDDCWIKINEGNEILKELRNKQNIICSHMLSVLNEKVPELIPVFEDYQNAYMEKEIEEDRAIYIQGAKDMVYLFKKIGIF